MHWDGREKVSGKDGQPWGLAWPGLLTCFVTSLTKQAVSAVVCQDGGCISRWRKTVCKMQRV